jgi:hypothetical protein
MGDVDDYANNLEHSGGYSQVESYVVSDVRGYYEWALARAAEDAESLSSPLPTKRKREN